MKRKKRVIAFVSALLILMYGTVPSFSAFADAEEDVLTEELLVSVPVEEATTENANVSNNTSTPSVSSSNNNVSTPSSKSDASSTISNNANTADHTPILLYIIICALSMFGIGFSFPHKDKY